MAQHREPSGWNPIATLIVWIGIILLGVAVVFLFVGVMHEPIGAEPGRGVVTIAPPGPSGGVR